MPWRWSSWFKQKGAERSSITRLFTHEDDEVRHTAFRVCGDLRTKKFFAPAEKDLCNGESGINKLEILNSLCKDPGREET